MTWIRWLVLSLILSSYSLKPVSGQTDEAKWERVVALAQYGPCTVDLGDQATLAVPVGLTFLPPEASRLFDELSHNLSPVELVGTITSSDSDPKRVWFLRFEYLDTGRIPDDERDQLDANALLAEIKTNQESSNNILRSKGWSTLQIDGWQNVPHYNHGLKRLEWCILAHGDDGHLVANFNTRLLGRTGMMKVVAVGEPEVMQQIMPQINQVLAGFNFKSGKTWAEWKPGDKTATYGLAALITGGTTVALAKSGFLAKFGKFIVGGVVGLFAMLGQAFRSKTTIVKKE